MILLKTLFYFKISLKMQAKKKTTDISNFSLQQYFIMFYYPVNLYHTIFEQVFKYNFKHTRIYY